MTPPDAVLFDLDRTLVDVQSHTDYAAALADVEQAIGGWEHPPTPPTGWDGPTRRAMGVLVALAGDGRWQAVSDVIERHESAAVTRATAMPGLRTALECPARRPRAVVTLLPATTARAVLDRFEIPIATLIPRRADLAPKPAPDQLAVAIARLGVPPARTTMLGDSTWDAEAADAAGCRFVGITNGGRSEFPATVVVAANLVEAVALL